MSEKTLEKEAEKLSNESYSYLKPKPEYVLRVNNIRSAPLSNPSNLPAVIKPSFLSRARKGAIILVLLFTSTFLISTFLGYNLLFSLFR